MSKKTDAIYVTFEPDIKRALSECAKREERTLQAQVRKFVVEGLEREEGKRINETVRIPTELTVKIPGHKPKPENIGERPAPPPPPPPKKVEEEPVPLPPTRSPLREISGSRSPLRVAREQAEKGEQ